MTTEREEALTVQRYEPASSIPEAPAMVHNALGRWCLYHEAEAAIRLARVQPQGEPVEFRSLLEEAVEGFSRVLVATSDNERVYGWLKRVRVALKASPPAQAVPEGFVLVPKTLTPEMRNAGMDSGKFTVGAIEYQNIHEMWAAMLSAAPKPGGKE